MFLIWSTVIVRLHMIFSNILMLAGTVASMSTTATATQTASSNGGNSSDSIGGWICNSILLPVFISIITSFATALFTARWAYRREKRIEGEYGHHKQLNQALLELQEMMKSWTQDENPFCLLYKPAVIVANGLLKIPFGTVANCVGTLKPIAERINKLISEQDVNINPTNISMEEWTNCQHTLRTFTRLIIEKWGVETVESYTGVHRQEWQAFKQSVEKLKEATDYTGQ